MDHLADLGHRAIAFVGHGADVYRRGSGFAARTLEGVTTRAAARGLSATTCVLRRARGRRRDRRRVLSRRPPVTGLVVHNEAALPMLLDALRAAGRRVPEDVSVVAIAPPTSPR